MDAYGVAAHKTGSGVLGVAPTAIDHPYIQRIKFVRSPYMPLPKLSIPSESRPKSGGG